MAEGPVGFHASMVRGLDPNEPVVMLNLMKFRAKSADGDGTGWEAFQRYSRLANPLMRAGRGMALWACPVYGVALGPEAEGDWDFAALAWYPTPGAFLDVMTSEAYAEANVHRENGIERHLVIATRTDYARFELPSD